MPIALEDLPGMRFGLVTVIEWSHRDTYWNNYLKCACDCGAIVTKRASQLRYGKFHTCGAEACRFWEKVDKNGPVISKKLGPCHVWTGATNSGYGVFKAENENKVLRAHVYTWELKEGSVPDGVSVLHKCDNRPCIRKSHLFLGTHQDNMQDMALKGRARSGLGSKPRLTQQGRELLRADALSGMTYLRLSIKYGITERTIGRIISGR